MMQHGSIWCIHPGGFPAALGEPTIELWLNERIKRSATNAPIIFTWLEPLGLGGHVLYTPLGKGLAPQRGCFECVYARANSGKIFCRASFADPGGQYTLDDLGCGSRHTPFASLDAEQVAILCSRVALQVLSKALIAPELRSWKGDSQRFNEAGHRTTPRFELSQPELDARARHFGRETCPTCSHE